MRRFQLFEFLDQAWLPATFRSALTRYLATAYATTPFPTLWAKIILQILQQNHLHCIVDLGSGAGGPIRLILKQLADLGHFPTLTLTDIFPVITPPEPRVSYWPDPVSAVAVPPQLSGLRTLCVFEAPSRTAPAIASAFLIPLLVLIRTPAVRPIRLSQVFFT